MNYTLNNFRETYTRILLLLLGFISSFSMDVTAQETTVTGIINSEAGNPISGASITVKGTTRGTSTNSEGRFSISAAPNATLVVSSVGFGTLEIDVAGRSNIPITLSAATTQLEQV